MSRLASLLGHEDHRPLRNALHASNQIVDGSAHDVAVLGELAQKTAQLKQSLLLDHQDTTAYELYVSLRQRITDDNVRLARALGIAHENAVSEATPRIISAVAQEYAQAQCFVPKSSVLKAIIKKYQPKEVMGALHYRSIDSLLKHESAAHIVTLARYLESQDWLTRYTALLEELEPQDFEVRPLEVVWLDKAALVEPLSRSYGRHHLVLHAKEAGCIAVAPTAELVIYGYTIRTLVLLEHYAHEVLYLSSYARAISTSHSFGREYSHALATTHEAHIHVAEHPVHWRSMHHAIASSSIQDILPPHLSVERWQSSHANDKLAAYNDIITFWDGFGHVITPDHEPVSASVIDLSIDTSHQVSFDQRSLKYGRRALEQELFSRYLKEPRISRLVFHRLNLT